MNVVVGKCRGPKAELVEHVRVILAQDPKLKYAEIADRLEAWRPDLMTSRTHGSRMQTIYRCVKAIRDNATFSVNIPLPEAEEARRIFVRKAREVWHEAMKKGDLATALKAARDEARACGADIDVPLRVEVAHSSMDLGNVATEHLAAFVASLSDTDKSAVLRSFPHLNLTTTEPN